MSNLVLSYDEELSLKCKFEGVRYQAKDSDFKVIRFKVLDTYCPCPPEIQKGSVITAVGLCLAEVLNDCVPVHVTGTWGESKYGNQLKIKSVVPVMPTTDEGILRYLSSGIIKGIGEVTARRLVDHFGKDTLKILDDSPERVKEVKGIGELTAAKIISSWRQQRDMAEMLSTICSFGLSVTYARKALHHFGPDAPRIIKENPYALTELHGIGFLKADIIARRNGVDLDHPERVRAGINYVMDSAASTEGHCYLPVDELVSRAVKLLGVTDEAVRDRLQESDMAGRLVLHGDRVYMKWLYEAELYASQRMVELAYIPSVLYGRDIRSSFSLTEEQQQAIRTAFRSRLSCITGLPGTGKTTSIRAVISMLESAGLRYELAAPTGKAARRITEQTGREAKTIHRLLEFKKDGSFARNQQRPLETDFVIIDESSMIDITLMASLLRAIQGRTALMLLGDYNQLPPVGPGNLLRDIVDRGLCPVSRLTRIHRQAEGSMIIRAAHIINSGGYLNIPDTEDMVFRRVEAPEDIRRTILNEVRDIGSTQVLSPMKKGVIGTVELNRAIRGLFFEDSGEPTRIPFKKGDRVIQRHNNYEKGVFNGEIGFVRDIDEEENLLSVVFDDDREVFYEDFEFDDLDFAYALTVHKSQGSEYDTVIIPVSTSHYVMLFRNLLYTAITRARRRVVLVGTDMAVNIAIRNNKPINRFTSLGLLC